MKTQYLLLLALVFFISCENEPSEDEPLQAKYPLELLDQTNFNNASNVLSIPNKNVRLDSIVYINYYQYNPKYRYFRLSN